MTTKHREGLALVICAPSGTGKTTLIRRLCAEFPLQFSISCTTRKPRNGEVDGVDYHFLSHENFKNRIGTGYFAEWAEVHDNYYGSPLKPIQEMLGSGQDILFDIDVQGAAQLALSLPLAKFIFIYPPNLSILKERLIGRGTDSAESIAKRLTNAEHEIKAAHWFDAWLMNDDLDSAYDRLRAFYLSGTLAPQLNKNQLTALLSTK